MLVPSLLATMVATASPAPELVARHFMEQVSSGQLAAASAPFTEQMKAGMPPDRLGIVWRGLESKDGAFEKIERISAETVGDGTAELVTCRFAKAPETFEVYVDSAGHIAGFFLTPAPIVARRFVNDLAESDFEGAEAMLSPRMRAATPVAKLTSIWKDLITRSGAFQQIDRASVERNLGEWVAVVTAQFAKASVVLRVTVDGDARIDDFVRQ